MNLEEDIKDIKERLERIEAWGNQITEILKGARTEPNNAKDSSAAFEPVNFEVQKSDSPIGPEYAYKLTVRNRSNESRQFVGSVLFLDSNGFQIEDHVIVPFTVNAGDTFTKTGRYTITDQSKAARIADVTAELRPF